MPRPALGYIRINASLPPKILKALQTLAARRSTTVSDLLRAAARRYLLEELPKEKADQ